MIAGGLDILLRTIQDTSLAKGDIAFGSGIGGVIPQRGKELREVIIFIREGRPAGGPGTPLAVP